ncbi:dimethylallyltransferase [Marinobacterium nitratireducens]|uniref:Dimethylallyltransferase n=1 Tax=Marinobacterium nitratireducens TaxID=518897 RepID=A0A918DW96_9GAMM|nr:type 1 glutamine amidotransferase domain-containing protein [Marinobacterium nitratireducens]GGO87391.1 dimethylallyltransferase [Marinobacterium nitratireducens]
MSQRILMVLTSHDRLGDSQHRTGFWLEEFAAPYYVFRDAGCAITLASPAGGQPPLDPRSDEPEAATAATDRFRADSDATDALANTRKLEDLDAGDYDAVFFPGGHGPLWDLAENGDCIALIEALYSSGRPVAAVCHGPAALRHAFSAGEPLVRGLKVTGFSNQEEDAIGLTGIVPFLIEDMLRSNGGHYSRADVWQEYVVSDGRLVTGQNPASSAATARALLQLLG